MPGLLEFDASALNSYLKKYGLKETWAGILESHLRNKEKFHYILESDFFANLAKMELDILEGLSIGEIGVLYEYSVAYLDPNNRKESGQFFTPDDVAKVMVDLANSSSFDSNKIWLDPCSGIGNLSWHLCASREDPEKFLLSSLVLSDRDELALQIARVLFTVSFQNRRKSLYNQIEKNFVVFDFLSVSQAPDSHGLGEQSLKNIPKHDYVLVNPPYLATNKDLRFETQEARDLYAYFLENIIKTSIGFVSVTPQSFTNASKFRSLRKLMLANFDQLTISCFDNVPGNLFRGFKFGSKNSNTSNSIRAALTVAVRGGKKQHRITSLIRWKSEDRALLLKNLDRFLTTVTLIEDCFPKINGTFRGLYKELTSPGMNTIGDLVSTNGQFVLHIPSSPRYFISALKTPVDRVSMHTLCFPDKKSRDCAYLLLNSSVAYWWWRVRDGGMTLSLNTLLSTPVPDFAVKPNLVLKLEKSEVSNKVYKNNAGASRENVKHSSDLIFQLNQAISPNWAQKLMQVHQNSEFEQL